MNIRDTSHQILAQMTVGLNNLATGIGDGWLAPIQGNTSRSHHDDIFLTLDEYSLVSWLEMIGIIFGATMAAIVLDKVGRKFLVTVCAVAFCLQWLAVLFANSAFLFYLKGAMFGIATGIHEVSYCVYFGENCSPSNRAKLGTICISLYYLGIPIGFILTNSFDFRSAAIFNFIIAFLSLLSVFWLVEPVQYLVMKGKYDQAQKNFAWLKDVNDPAELAAEFEKIKQNVHVETSKKSSWLEILTSPTRHKSLLIMLTLYTLIGITDYEHAPRIFIDYFETSSIYESKPFIILLWVAQFLIAASSSVIIDRYNMRFVMLISCSLISLAYAVFGMLFLIELFVVFPDSLKLFFTYIREIFFDVVAAFFYPTLFILQSELFPLSINL